VTPLLDVSELCIRLPSANGWASVVDHVSFMLGRGETLGLVGESGCGKSMTALAIMQLLPPSARLSGKIDVAGVDVVTTRELVLSAMRGRRMAMVFQEPMTALNPVQTIGAQIGETLRQHFGLTRAEARARARLGLDRVGLAAPRFTLDLYPHQLSGGQRQRVMIAMALAGEPDLLIADEPTTALDVTTQAQILRLLSELAAERGLALLLITHDLGIVAQVTARIMVMYSGRVVESGPTPEVFRRMAHPYTRALFNASPHAALLASGQGRARLASIPGQVPAPGARPPGCPFSNRCRRVQRDCLETLPALEPIETPAHRAACYHPEPR
jgi:peptide/nickel transport system ATP-binding protein